MIPDFIPTDAPDSERYVYSRLRATLPENWVVIHGRRFVLPGRNGAFEGELDFLVIDPMKGAIGLEVKGGGIERKGNDWISTDRDGNKNSIRDPGKQASAATHAIHRFLRESPGFGARHPCATSWGVVLPDCDVYRALGPDLPREITIDRSDFADLPAAINRVFEFQGVDGPALPAQAVEELVETLTPTCRLIPSLAARFSHDKESLIRLTEEQLAVLDGLDANNRIAIEGAAGTGKTLLALEKARKLAEQGKRTLLLCFNAPLADNLRESARGFEVYTFHALCREKARLASVGFTVPKGKEQQQFWEDDAPLKLLEALEALDQDRYDAVIVDEGQDFRENWWPSIEEMLRDIKQSTFYVFFDPNQNLYGGGPPRQLDVFNFKLQFNCRNTSRIAEYASKFSGVEPRMRPGAPIGADVELIECVDEPEVSKAVRKLIHRLVVDEKIDPADIVVLTNHATKTSVLKQTRQLGNFRLVELGTRKSGTDIAFTSSRRFKGLEADVVILVDVTTGEVEGQSDLLYVATSRARHLLVIVSQH